MSQVFNIAEWEQGTIDEYGNNESSSTRVRMPAYIAVNSRSDLATTFIATASDTNGTLLKINIMMYDSNHNVVYDNGWNDSGEVLTYNKNISYIRLILRYSDSRNIIPSDVSSCTVIYSNGVDWIIENNQLTNTEFIAMPDKPFVGDSPLSMWRIQDGVLQTGLSIPREALGAFANATNLKRVEIPRSVKSIGAEAFRNTLLTSVTIASDCTYSSTSFPEGCVINFYPD